MSSAKIKTQNNQWLSQYVFPLWMEKGVDSQNGGFIESIEHNGSPQDVPRRAMVQARQIYAFTEMVRPFNCKMNCTHRRFYFLVWPELLNFCKMLKLKNALFNF